MTEVDPQQAIDDYIESQAFEDDGEEAGCRCSTRREDESYCCHPGTGVNATEIGRRLRELHAAGGYEERRLFLSRKDVHWESERHHDPDAEALLDALYDDWVNDRRTALT